MSLDELLFQQAVQFAKDRAYWLASAEVPTEQFGRRRCLALARRCEAHVFNLSIKAEKRFLRELDIQGATA